MIPAITKPQNKMANIDNTIPFVNSHGIIKINADANNPGGITATGKSCIYYTTDAINFV